MATTWTDYRGRKWPVCSCLKAWLPVYQAELIRLGVIKVGLDVWQTIGGAAASGGTHSRGQCVDTAQTSVKAIEIARQMGADASWHRRKNWDNRGGMAHAHLNLRGCPHGTAAADSQYSSTWSGVDHGKNGLANGARDDGPKPLSKRTWQEGIAWAKARQTPTPPKKKPKTIFRFGQWSLAGFDTVYGKKNWDNTVNGVVKEIARLGARAWSLTEVPEPKVASFDAKLRKRGLKVAISDNGRTILVESDVKVGRTKVVTLKEEGPAKDNKQIVLAEIWPSGPNPWVIEAGHYEYRTGSDYDKTRVTQGEQAKAATLAFAKTCGVPPERVIFGDDENSNSLVLTEAFEPEFVDALDVAYKSMNKAYATIVGWLRKTPKGPRSDRVKVHKNRPVAAARVSAVSSKLGVSDHAPTVVDVGQI